MVALKPILMSSRRNGPGNGDNPRRSQLSFSISLENLLREEWMAFKLTYNKSYRTPEEENFRREIFIENRRKIAVFNQEYVADNGLLSSS
ncbi:hypothetical protein MTP99_007327 [Tenebrio molitor]|nr:hypothetical protein MTP99_007327 [Tenebrio molitor]